MRKTVNILTIIIIFSFLLSMCNILSANPEQSFIIYTEGNSYIVKTDITGEVVFSSGDASTSIQWAIDNIDNIGINGGEVYVEAGDYPLSNCIILKDNIWFHGKGKSTHLYIIGKIMEAILVQDASMAVVSDISLSNRINNVRSAIGILIERSVNCQVLDVYVSGFNKGIFNSGESSMTLITGNTLTNNTTNIDIPNGGGVIGRWLPIMVSENTIKGGEIGISCNALCTNIIKNTITKLSGRAIVANANSIVVRQNKISDIEGDYAIWGNGQEFNCTDNIITNVKGGGIRAYSRWGTITNNYISDCGTSGNPSTGILIESDEAIKEGTAESKVIFRNTVFNKDGHVPLEYGIKEEGSKNVIAENKIGNCSKEAIHSEGKGTIVVSNSGINK